MDAAGLAADVTAAVVPGLPGGAGTAYKAAKRVEKAADAGKKAENVASAAKDISQSGEHLATGLKDLNDSNLKCNLLSANGEIFETKA